MLFKVDIPFFINPVFCVHYYPRDDRVALKSSQVNHVENISNYLSRDSVRARATEEGKSDKKNKHRARTSRNKELTKFSK
jgi:hypothetical protein